MPLWNLNSSGGSGGGGGAPSGSAGGDLSGTYPNPTVVDGNIDHGSVGGLTDDDHSQYVLTAPAATARNLVTSTDAASVPLTLKGAALQSADLQDWLNSAGVPVGRVYLHSAGTGGIEMWSSGSVTTRLYAFYGLELSADREMRWSNAGANLTTIDTAIQRSAASQLRITNGSSGIGSLLCSRVVTARTIDVTLAATASRTCVTNDGAVDIVVAELPTAVLGLEFMFTVLAAQDLIVTAMGTDTIRIAASVSSAGGTATSSTVGNVLLLTCTKTGAWTALSQGTWTLA